MAAEIGTGTTITFQTGFFAEIVDMNWSNMAREAIDQSHFGSGSLKSFRAGALVDYGELEVTMHFRPAVKPPLTNAAETVTVTFPDAGAATWAFSGFMIGFDLKNPLEDKAVATCRLKVAGDVTVTP